MSEVKFIYCSTEVWAKLSLFIVVLKLSVKLSLFSAVLKYEWS